MNANMANRTTKTTTTKTNSTARSSMSLRLNWLMRLVAICLRRHRFAAAACCCALAVATVALVACVGWFSGASAAAERSISGAAAEQVELVAFLREDLPSSARDTLSGVLARLPGVVDVRLLGSGEALARMRIELGERASVLDGVEEGFLPATLEVTLRSGVDGGERADALAWRLRRMEGITDVDVLRSVEDERIARAELMGRRLGHLGIGLAVMTGLLAFCLAGLALRRQPSDALLLTGLGFTAGAVAAPGATIGALCGLTGAGLATSVAALAARITRAGWWQGFPLGPTLPTTWSGGKCLLTAAAVVVVSGAALGWWGSRLSSREVDEVAATG